jgi:ribonuclease J
MTITAFSVSHSTPQSVGFYIDTPAGTIVNAGDFKLDPTVTWGPGFNEEQFKRIVKKRVDLLLLDSTGADRAGAPQQEKDLQDILHKLIKENPDKRFVATVMGGFEENLASCAKVAAETGRALFVAGAAHEQSLDALARTGLSLKDYVGYTLDLRILTKGREAFNLASMKPANAMVILTGALGHQHAELTKAARGQSQKIKLDPKQDVILFCAPSIPGQEAGREKLIAHLKAQGFSVLTHKDIPALYPRAHAGQDEMIRLIELAQPKVIIPQHGNDHLREKAANLCKAHSKAEVITLKNAEAVEMRGDKFVRIENETEAEARQQWLGLKTRQGRNWKNRDYFVIHAPQDDAALHAVEKDRHQGKAMPKAYTLYQRR